MERNQLDDHREWFSAYVASYYTGDEDYDRPIRLKEVHTGHVCENIIYLADQLNLTMQDRLLLEAIALFHDLGRFEQYKQHGTFVDAASVNHAHLGIRILMTHRLLSSCGSEEKRLITKAIAYHNAAAIPDSSNGKAQLYMALIRDADKLDIWRVLIDYYHERDDNPSAAIELGVPDDPHCSPEIIDALMARRSALLKNARTVNDAILLQISWVFDLNFYASMRRVLDREYIPQLLAFLPQTKTVEQAVDIAIDYIKAGAARSDTGIGFSSD